MRCIVLLVVLAALSCSKDRPVSVAPAGKSLASLAAPPAPTNLRFDAPTDSSCTVRWDASAGATHYYVNYRLASGGRWTNVPHQDVRLYNTIHDLQPNTEYRWAVRAENDNGTSAWAFGPHFTTLRDQAESGEGTSQPEGPSTRAPDPPTNLRIADLTKTSVRLRWDAVEEATDYDVSYRRTAGGEWKAVPHEGTKLYSTLTGLEPNTEYSWAVRAENDLGASAWVYADNFTTLRDQAESGEGTSQPEGPSTRAPDPPTNLRIADLTKTSVRLRWDAVEEATDYDVSYRRTAGGEWKAVPHEGTKLYSTLTGLEPNTEYSWAVRAENDLGASAWVYADNFTTLRDQAESGEGTSQPEEPSTRAPDPPTNLRIEAITNTSARVRWDAVEGATDYDVSYRRTAGGEWKAVPHEGTKLYSTLTGLEPNTEYSWAVRAENDLGASAWVYADNFTTLRDQAESGEGTSQPEEPSTRAPDPPTNLRIEAITNTSARVRWDAVEGATDYDVSYRRTAGGEWKAVPHEGTKLYSTLIGLEPNTEYSWAVRAENDLGASAWVYADNFTTLRDQAESGEGTSQPEEPSQDGDRAALVALYHATGGDNWTKNNNWLSSKPLKDWYGVEANAQGRVIRLSLWNNRLGGAIPPELGDLEKLDFLWLHTNQLSGPIPPQLGQLTNLTELGLHNNQLSGSIPSQLGQFQNLIALHLASNQLSGPIPPQLGRLRKLEFLWLSSNQLSGSIPPELGQLRNLRALELVSNRLSGSIPPELGQLRNLEGVFLKGNRLTGCLPSAWRDVRYNDLDESGLPFCGDTDGSSDVDSFSDEFDIDPTDFNIDVVFVDDSFTANQQRLIRNAAARWEAIIVGDVPTVSFRQDPLDEWSSFSQARIQVNGEVDDLRIFVAMRSIDGVDGTLAGARPYLFRSNSWLPCVAEIIYDTADQYGETANAFYSTILHEMGHALGFGAIWPYLGLLENPSAGSTRLVDTHFSGERAREAFGQARGPRKDWSYAGAIVPVENLPIFQVDAHWRELVMVNELMTSVGAVEPLSAITIQSLADIGYRVDVSQADPYTLPRPRGAKRPAQEASGPPACLVLPPVYAVDPNGQRVPIGEFER